MTILLLTKSLVIREMGAHRTQRESHMFTTCPDILHSNTMSVLYTKAPQ